MTNPSLPLLRLESEISEELRLALRQDPGELPSADALGALRARLAVDIGPIVRLRERAPLDEGTLQTALLDHPSELPNPAQLRVLARRVAKTSHARPAAAVRRVRPVLIAACLLIACLAAAASYWAARHREGQVPPAKPSTSVSGEHAIRPEPASKLTPPDPSPEPAPPLETDVAARPSSAPAKAPPAVAVEGPSELDLLREAQRLQAGEPAAALAVVARHQRLFPSGILAQEREMVAIEALMRLGRRDAARARAATFLRQYPGSVHAVRIRELIGESAPATSARPSEASSATAGAAPIFSP